MKGPFSTKLVTLAASCALLLPLTTGRAAAQGRRGAPDRGSLSAESDYDRGFREGLREGEQDARRGRTFDSQRNPRYDARDDYRRGFAAGYRSGFERGRTRGGGSFGLGIGAQRRPGTLQQEPASARGYSDGYNRGASDGREHGRYDPVREKDYRDGDNGYTAAYGTRDAYRNNYRLGFRQGYEDGYRDGTAGRE